MSGAGFQLVDDRTPPIPTADVSIARAYGLRPYQAEAIASIEGGWSEEVTRQLAALATGCGKTIIFATAARREKERGGRTLILAHTDELIDQAIDKLRRAAGLRAAKEKADSYASRFEKVVVGSVQTLCRDLRLSSWPAKHFTLVVVDEAHRSLADSYQKILKRFNEGGAKILGVTATADRGDKRTLGEFYQRVSYDYGLLQAVRDGWLIRPFVKTMPLSIDLRGVKTRQTSDGADFDRMQVGERLVPFLGAIAAAIKAEIGAKQAILFLPSVETSQRMAEALSAIGVRCDWVCGDKELCPDRTERIQRYKTGATQAICNMGVLTEGFDHDAIEFLVILRPTKIRSLFAQMVGRGTRPLTAIVPLLAQAANALERMQLIQRSAKPRVTILDFLWLYEKHDLICPASLVSTKPEIMQAMRGTQGDLIDGAERAERDLLAQLEKEVRKHEHKQSKVVDPLAIATELGDVELATYEPETNLDAQPASEKQLKILRQNRVDVAKVTCRGHASALIAMILRRHERQLATIGQLNFLHRLGIDATLMPRTEASRLIGERLSALELRKYAAEWEAIR